VITYLAKRGFENSMTSWTDDYEGPSAPLEVMSYEDLADAESIASGVIVFSDIERLSAEERRFADEVRRCVQDADPSAVFLNDPLRTLRRYDLLAELHTRGMNPVRAYRLSDTRTPQRFPVFLRYENDHTGATTDLLEDQYALDRAIVRSKLRGHDLRKMLIVEYVDTSVDGTFEKFGAFVVGARIIARSRNVSDHWVVKAPSLWDLEYEPLAMEYVRENPHAKDLRPFFEAARISYGRIDYSLLNGEIVVWEINTNPRAFSEPSAEYLQTRPRQELVSTALAEAFDELHGPRRAVQRVDLTSIPNELRDHVRYRSGSYAPSRFAAWRRRHKDRLEPLVGAAGVAVSPLESRLAERWRHGGW
jgi:hypothetical protein